MLKQGKYSFANYFCKYSGSEYFLNSSNKFMGNKIQQIKDIAKQKMNGLDPSHDYSHVVRVYNLCLLIAKSEKNVELDVLKIAALLHDIARSNEESDKTRKTDHAILGAKLAEQILQELDYSQEKIDKIKHCILTHRFRNENKPRTIEAKILFDADKLEGIGAIGISRSFASVGVYNQKIYFDEDIETYIKENFVGGTTKGKIKDLSRHTPNIEYWTKFIRVQDMLFTEKAKELAMARTKFMTVFFNQLKKEVKGEL